MARFFGAAATALVLIGIAVPVPARAQAPSPVLSTLEVRQLVASTDPAAQARLAAHFAALGDRYAAEAKRHLALAGAFSGGAGGRTSANTPAAHCRRLAELNAASSQVLRQLAEHHRTLAAGATSVAPAGAAPFDAGAGAPEPSDAELAALAAKASTPADHHALEEYFATVAKRYTADVQAHVAMAQAYRGTRAVSAAAHCDRLVKLGRDAAKEATAMAEHHRQLAGVTR